MFDRDALIAAIYDRYLVIGNYWWCIDDVPDFLDDVMSNGHYDNISFDQIVVMVSDYMYDCD